MPRERATVVDGGGKGSESRDTVGATGPEEKVAVVDEVDEDSAIKEVVCEECRRLPLLLEVIENASTTRSTGRHSRLLFKRRVGWLRQQ